MYIPGDNINHLLNNPTNGGNPAVDIIAITGLNKPPILEVDFIDTYVCIIPTSKLIVFFCL